MRAGAAAQLINQFTQRLSYPIDCLGGVRGRMAADFFQAFLDRVQAALDLARIDGKRTRVT